jgi:hypothetical protein
MSRYDVKDLIGGAILIVLGIFAAVFAAMTLEIGSPARMGPGLFPIALGVLLTGFGILILIRALILRGAFELPQFEMRPFLAITASAASFALAIETVGAVPAIVIMTLVARLADERIGFVRPLILGCILALIATLIFSVGLELPIYPFIRPF